MHILLPETDNCPSWISRRERMTVENISWSITTKECCRPQLGSNPRPPGLQLDAHPTEPLRPASPAFTDNPLYTALWHHSNKNSMAINNRYLDSLVNDNHVDNNLKEILMYVYYGSIVNNPPKKPRLMNGSMDGQTDGNPDTFVITAWGNINDFLLNKRSVKIWTFEE